MRKNKQNFPIRANAGPCRDEIKLLCCFWSYYHDTQYAHQNLMIGHHQVHIGKQFWMLLYRLLAGNLTSFVVPTLGSHFGTSIKISLSLSVSQSVRPTKSGSGDSSGGK